MPHTKEHVSIDSEKFSSHTVKFYHFYFCLRFSLAGVENVQYCAKLKVLFIFTVNRQYDTKAVPNFFDAKTILLNYCCRNRVHNYRNELNME